MNNKFGWLDGLLIVLVYFRLVSFYVGWFRLASFGSVSFRLISIGSVRFGLVSLVWFVGWLVAWLLGRVGLIWFRFFSCGFDLFL